MAVVFSVVCDCCGDRRDEPRAFHFGSARARSAVHGWVQHEHRGAVRDVCPACVQAEMAATPVAIGAASRALVGSMAASAGRAAPAAVVHAAVLVEHDVAMCAWCEAGDCWVCSREGCECTSTRHAAAG